MAELTIFLAILITTLLLSATFLIYSLQNHGRRGVNSIAVMFVGIGIWVLSDIIQTLTGPDPTAWGGMALRLLGIEITCIGILLLGLEYTGRDRFISKELLALLSIEPIAIIALSLSPRQDLLFGVEESATAPWGYEVVQTPLWMGHVVYSYILVAIGLGLLVLMMIRADHGFHRQLSAIVIALLIPLLANSLFHIGITPFDLTPSSFLLTAVILMYATFQLRLLDAIPIARQTVIEEMGDMVFVLDEQGYVTTVNKAAEEMFGQDSRLVGRPIGEILDEDVLGDASYTEESTELTIKRDGEYRHLDVKKSLLTDHRDNLLAQLLVCRDLTEHRRREEQIELLKDVQSRFLRHNLRNELNTILAHADFMKRGDGPGREESHERIVETSNRLLEWGEKARTIERLVESTEQARYDLSELLAGLVSTYQEEYPDIEFETDFESRAWIVAVPQIDSAFENLIENAAEYNTSDDPVVLVSSEVDEEQVRIRITDNGPGINEGEIAAVEQEQETQLKHSSGFGLWLVYWVVDKSGGDITFESNGGTTVTLTFERVAPPAADSNDS